MTPLKKYLICIVLVFARFDCIALEQSTSVNVTTILKTQTTWDGKDITYPQGKAEVTGLLVEIAPGAETGWHLHPVPSFGLILEGELEVTLKTGEKKRMKAGESIAEVINTYHNGRNVGNTPVKLVVFYAGAVGQPLTKAESKENPTYLKTDKGEK